MRDYLSGQHILVLGLGESGLAMARWCAARGAQVTVADTRDAPPRLARLRAEVPQARWLHGPIDAGLLAGTHYDAAYRSPGIAPAQLAPFRDAAKARGLFVGGEIDLFVAALAVLRAERNYAPKLVAITGTNGKTTVTDLTAHLLRGAGVAAVAAGNISPSLLDALAAQLEQRALPAVWVLELSSFQLDVAHAFAPDVAAVLNITQDHLDWHGGMAAYAAAKARVFGVGTVRLLNRDDPRVMALQPVRGAALTFGADAPTAPGDFGLDIASGMAWLARVPCAPAGASPERLLPEGALRIHGRHNALNALAALALAERCGAPMAPMLRALRDYRGGPHRVESLGIIDGAEYFDDSKGTNVGATAAALAGLGASRRVVIILGGDGKGQDFAPLAAPVAAHARAVVLIGRDAPQIRAVLARSGVPLLAAKTMAGAVALAAQNARAGDAVLLSPACASFDMFRSYLHRAEVFQDAVRELARSRGIELEVAP